MLKLVHNEIWAFDAEWVPDPVTGRMVYGLADDMPDDEVLRTMYARGGATADVPRPYLKTVLCRIVSVAFVRRFTNKQGELELGLHSYPLAGAGSYNERELLMRFVGGMGKNRPQLVGFNSVSADLPILMQRSLVHSLLQPEFCKRPEKPWGGVDYFMRNSDWHVDLKEVVGGFGKSSSSLHELATSCGIPGKLDTAGADVVDHWASGNIRRIVQYNECDALTTYLVWLRVAHLCGFVNETEFVDEQDKLERLLTTRAEQPDNAHLTRYLDEWKRLRGVRRTAMEAIP